ncbi:MAG: hypothetical protein O7F16_12550 [Acidobacteria bacterium]|nr:hypothetical protein [Acidobacteriota bacterium]
MTELADLQEEIRSLCSQAEAWGRHYLKHIAVLRRAAASLLPQLTDSRELSPLTSEWRAGQPPVRAPLEAVPSETGEHFLDRVQCFYTLQLLRLHRDSLERLRARARSAPQDAASLRDILVDIERRHEWISRTTIEAMLREFLRDQDVPAFALFNVGTSLHLDDIDVAVVAAADSAPLNHALSRLTMEMIRRASRLHFYLAEQLQTDSYYAPMDRYHHWIKQGVRNYVGVSELLSARFITGDPQLYERFGREIGERFYYTLGSTAEHYAYMRGMLTEVRSFFRHDPEAFSINFKRDAIRAIRALVSAESTRYSIHATSVWKALNILCSKEERLREVYQGLEEVLVLFEIFRYLYQLFVVQEEHLALSDDEILGVLDPIARELGYEEIRHIRPGNRLLLEYSAALIRSRRLVQTLLDQERIYVRALHVFGKIARSGQFVTSLAEIRGNMGREFLEVVRWFRGTPFWQDILRLLTNIDRDSLRRFADDLLEPGEGPSLVERYVRLVSQDTRSLLRLLLVIGEHRDYGRVSHLFWMFMESWQQRLSRKVAERERLLSFYQRDPKPFVRLLQCLDQKHQQALLETLSRPVLDPELVKVRSGLLHVLATFTRCSRFFERTLRHVVERHPEVLKHLDDGRALGRMGRWMLTRSLRLRDIDAGLAEARSHYELEFVRLGTEIMNGRRIPILLRDFRRMSERTVTALATLCHRRLREEAFPAAPPETEPPYAILATGGNAREEGYLADYDVIFLAPEDEQLNFCQRVAVHFNAELTRVGILPHHLLADHFGRYALTIGDLRGLLQKGCGQDFAERSEILGARFVYGSSRLYEEFVREIVDGEVLLHRKSYLLAMLADERARQKPTPEAGRRMIRLKFDRGSLKEIHLTLDLLRAHFSIIEPGARRLLAKLVKRDPEHREEYYTLLRSLNFLVRMRVLYQLTVGHYGTIDPQQMGHAIDALRIKVRPGDDPAEALLGRYRRRTARSARASARLSTWLRGELEDGAGRQTVDRIPPSSIL